MEAISYEKEILTFMKIHHCVSLNQLISFIYKLISLDYEITENEEDTDLVCRTAYKIIKKIVERGDIILKDSLCIAVNHYVEDSCILEKSYRTKLSKKQEIAIWFHISQFESIGFNVFIPPEESDYETLLYWKNRENCICVSATVLESNYTKTDNSYKTKDIVKKNKAIINRYYKYDKYEERRRIIEELRGSVEVKKIFLIDEEDSYNALRIQAENDLKEKKDPWMKNNVGAIGILKPKILFKKVFIPKFAFKTHF